MKTKSHVSAMRLPMAEFLISFVAMFLNSNNYKKVLSEIEMLK